ncbi:MAG: TrpB-like pyridoxal phosphate-dependent enzyme [Oscillospiraceae bacterium]|jgi:tryptophan synthase beta chain|nr:TrpB-like pyridoxal phosphate-dependent enzyme [Oscillospiraceae bacterium]
MAIPYRYYLPETEIPEKWYSLIPDMKNKPAPLLNPGTGQPLKAEELYPIFCEELAKQEVDNTTSYFDIPDEIREIYKVFRPSPFCRAYNLEKVLGTPAKIYYKYEGNNTSGSHKLNSSVAQAYYAKKQGITSLTTETGAGQWGTALSIACAYFNIPLTVYMVKVSYNQKPDRKNIIHTFGAEIIASPSDTTDAGRAILAADPNNNGSLGCAISEAVEKAVKTQNSRYVLGSVLNQVLLHQSVIGLESYSACEDLDVHPDIIIGCAGGGSNLGGLIAPFMRDKLRGNFGVISKDTRFVAVEPASCPSFTRGKFAYDFADTGHITPLAKMYTLGSTFIPSANHAGGLRYHGMSPILSQLYHDKEIEAVSYKQTDVFEAANVFAKAETILPAPESCHAIVKAIDEAKKCKETGEAKTILFGLTGTGFFDMKAYQSYLEGTMDDTVPTDEEIAKYVAELPSVPQS